MNRKSSEENTLINTSWKYMYIHGENKRELEVLLI